MVLPSGLALVSFPVISLRVGVDFECIQRPANAGIFVDSAVEAANMFRSDAEMVAYLGAGISQGVRAGSGGQTEMASKISFPPLNLKKLKKDLPPIFGGEMAASFRECISIV